MKKWIAIKYEGCGALQPQENFQKTPFKYNETPVINIEIRQMWTDYLCVCGALIRGGAL